MRGSKWAKVAVGLLLVGLLATALLVAGCGEKKTTETTEPEVTVVANPTTLKSGTLQMGSDTTYAPFEFMEGQKAVGFDIELATAIAARLGLKLEVISTAWDGIIPGLKSDKYDILMSAMTITPERAAEISFSDPYIGADQSIAVNNDSTIKTQEDLAGKVVGGQINTTGVDLAKKMQETGIAIKEIQTFDTIVLAFEALESGKLEAIVNDLPVNAYMSKERGKTKVVNEVVTDESYGIGVKKENTQMLTAINKALKAAVTDGTYDKIYTKWFGTITNVPKSSAPK